MLRSEEISIIKTGYKKKKSFDEIAEEINRFRFSIAKGKYILSKSPGGIPYDLESLGMITTEKRKELFELYHKEKKENVRKNAIHANLRKIEKMY